MAKKLKVEACKFVRLTEIVPETWREWFYEVLSENAPFSWGDNNRTLIHAYRIERQLEYMDIEDNGATEEEIEAFKKTLMELDKKEIYVDIEN